MKSKRSIGLWRILNAHPLHPLTFALALALLASAGCASKEKVGDESPRGSTTAGEQARSEDERCPSTLAAEHPLPNIPAAARSLDYWLERADERVLMSKEAILRHNRAVHGGGSRALSAGGLYEPINEEALLQRVRERIERIDEAFIAGNYRGAGGETITPYGVIPEALTRRKDELRRAEERIPLRCSPKLESFYRVPADLDFDRNNCSMIHEGEELEIISEFDERALLVRTRYAFGFIAKDAKLSAPINREEARARDLSRIESAPPLTRANVLREAFALLDEPYGWGGQNGGRDCSRYTLDILHRFGVDLPRHSASQAVTGRYSIDVEGIDDLDAKLELIDRAHEDGLVLLEFRGHIMLYLGRFQDGRPMAIHSFSEYLEPCEGGGETLRRADRVDVTDLSLGEGTSRTSFLERLRRVTVFSEETHADLLDLASPRQASPADSPARCTDSQEIALFTFPARPVRGQPLRVVAVTRRDLGPADLSIFSRDNTRLNENFELHGGAIRGYVASIDEAPLGPLEARLGDGDRVDACLRIPILRHPDPPSSAREAESPLYTPWRQWGEAAENLFAFFVYHLFAGLEPGETVRDLDVLIDDPSRNLFYNYLGLDEESALTLRPDCADLPYFLRAYYAYKRQLPFAYRRCTRGRENRPPRCVGEPRDSLEPLPNESELSALQSYLRRVANTVHSSSMRTLPDDEASDAYPIRLVREALIPGVTFADPYGHILVVVRTIPQRGAAPGALIAAEAQPDALVGVRTFSSGSFVFDPDTSSAGAGFKAFRPVHYDASTSTTHFTPNREIDGPLAFSLEQYAGSRDEFFERVDRAISPRPLRAEDELLRRVEALEESARRRVASVEAGEAYMERVGYAEMAMPEGSSIFLTTGPWEDFATPSRDLRLLIAIDEAVQFPKRAASDPSRYRGEVSLEALNAHLEALLKARTIEYKNSAGEPVSLDLLELIKRQEALEIAYNPNDCVEIRWGAPEGSPERESCTRRASDAQLAQMKSGEVRGWFRTRIRPAR